MVKEEILEGLRAAVAKGEPLRKAMMSFYNAGYPKQDIEEAARALQSPQFQPTIQTQVQPQQIQPVQLVQQPQPAATSYIPQTPQQLQFQPPVNVLQRVSGYGEKPKPLSAIITFVLVFFLLFLFGILIAVFLFKDEIAGFFNSILSIL